MDLSSSLTSSSDDEMKALNALLDAFCCACSLEDIAAAYCTANGDVNRAGDILSALQNSKSLGTEDVQHSETNLFQTEESVLSEAKISELEKPVQEKIVENSGQTNKHPKEEKLQKVCASFGTVSSMLGKGAGKASLSVNEASEKEKPLKLELPVYMRDDEYDMKFISDSATKKENFGNKDIEEFLFSMLGEGCKLNMNMIREVLDSCGYDIKKSMEELLSFSVRSLGKRTEMDGKVTKEYCPSEGSSIQSSSTLRNGSEVCSIQKENEKLRMKITPGELIESIFAFPERSVEEPKRKRFDLGANRSIVPDQKVVKEPLEDISSWSTDFPRKFIIDRKVPIVDEEDDYHNYLGAAKVHWDMMKHYYEKAVDAFREGNRKEAEYLLGEGKNYHEMARLAAEKSAGEIINTKKSELENALRLDLSTQDVTNISHLLEIHLKIPSFKYLKVIIGADDIGVKKGQRRKKVMNFLKRKSIEWTEDEANPGTIIIQLNQEDPS